ncbi:unnamed protein product [Gadus morhua 'NCC']
MQSNAVLDRKIHCTMGTVYLYHGKMQVANAIKCLKALLHHLLLLRLISSRLPQEDMGPSRQDLQP